MQSHDTRFRSNIVAYGEEEVGQTIQGTVAQASTNLVNAYFNTVCDQRALKPLIRWIKLLITNSHSSESILSCCLSVEEMVIFAIEEVMHEYLLLSVLGVIISRQVAASD